MEAWIHVGERPSQSLQKVSITESTFFIKISSLPYHVSLSIWRTGRDQKLSYLFFETSILIKSECYWFKRRVGKEEMCLTRVPKGVIVPKA
jgi:hypothetical protein